MHKKYRVAVVGGAGTWGRYYLQAYAKHPDCEIVALVDRAKDRRDAFAKRYGISLVLDSVEDLLQHQVPDIVSNIVPVTQTYSCVVACAEAGVRVVSCEKPIEIELSRADEMIGICRARGAVLACSQAVSATSHLLQVKDWIAAGNIGPLTGAAIPGGLPNEVSGGGCVQLTALRLVTGKEVEWVEGWTLPAQGKYQTPPGIAEVEADSPAYGRLGLSGGIVCEVPEPGLASAIVAVTGERGQVFLSRPVEILLHGFGAERAPVLADFLQEPERASRFDFTVERLLRAFDTGEEPVCSGHDYRQALEIAIALKQSAATGHKRIQLPLEERSAKLYPHPYRMSGGDVAGWESIGYTGPPDPAKH